MSVVLLIIGVLSAIILRGIGSQPIQARDSRRISDLRTLAIYLAQYMTKKGEFPPDSESATSTPPWNKLVTAFQDAGMSLYSLPVPPTKSETYIYYSCNANKNFILSATLEQLASSAPKLYEGTFDTTTAPWQCNSIGGVGAPSNTVDCDKSKNKYCLIQ
jgi:type II secretory pathway pseudopilin PulG